MKLKHLIFIAVISTVIANYQVAGQIDSSKIIAILSVSETQEQNFNLLIKWLDTSKAFNASKNLKDAYKVVFFAMKKNDYNEYLSVGKKFDAEISKLHDEHKKLLNQFSLTLTPVHDYGQLVPPGHGGNCSVSCLYGSCSISCPAGTKPKCFCDEGNHPQCGCEPYNVE